MAEYGFSQQEWDSAKQEARNAMIEQARKRGMLTYSDLVAEIGAIHFEPRDPRLFHLLGEISSEEDAAGRGMLSALVVHKVGDMEPGDGFFDLAKRLGRDTSDNLKCWVTEFKKVYSAWDDG